MTNTIVKIIESMVKKSNTIVLMTMTNFSETETMLSVWETANQAYPNPPIDLKTLQVAVDGLILQFSTSIPAIAGSLY
jgi:hypothetical protein